MRKTPLAKASGVLSAWATLGFPRLHEAERISKLPITGDSTGSTTRQRTETVAYRGHRASDP